MRAVCAAVPDGMCIGYLYKDLNFYMINDIISAFVGM
jgi:hypothetical protein